MLMPFTSLDTCFDIDTEMRTWPANLLEACITSSLHFYSACLVYVMIIVHNRDHKVSSVLYARRFLAKVWQYRSYKMMWQWVRTHFLSLLWLVSFTFFFTLLTRLCSLSWMWRGPPEWDTSRSPMYFCIVHRFIITCIWTPLPLGSYLPPDLHNVPGTPGNADNHDPREHFCFCHKTTTVPKSWLF